MRRRSSNQTVAHSTCTKQRAARRRQLQQQSWRPPLTGSGTAESPPFPPFRRRSPQRRPDTGARAAAIPSQARSAAAGAALTPARLGGGGSRMQKGPRLPCRHAPGGASSGTAAPQTHRLVLCLLRDTRYGPVWAAHGAVGRRRTRARVAFLRNAGGPVEDNAPHNCRAVVSTRDLDAGAAPRVGFVLGQRTRDRALG